MKQHKPQPVAEAEMRAQTARRLVKLYECGDAQAVTEILADLRHFCDKEQLDFGKLDATAYAKYLKELPRRIQV